MGTEGRLRAGREQILLMTRKSRVLIALAATLLVPVFILGAILTKGVLLFFFFSTLLVCLLLALIGGLVYALWKWALTGSWPK